MQVSKEERLRLRDMTEGEGASRLLIMRHQSFELQTLLFTQVATPTDKSNSMISTLDSCIPMSDNHDKRHTQLHKICHRAN